MITGNATPLPGWRGGDGNAAYLDKTLRYQPVELALNESVPGKTIFFLWLRAAIAGFLAGVIPTWIGFVSLMSGLGSSSHSYSLYGDEPSSADTGGAGWFVFASLASFVVFLLVLLMSRLPEPVGEWRVLLPDRPDRAETVYATILRTLGSRGYPLAPQAFGPRITLNNHPYTAYVSVFNYGSSLYLGWMMWRSRRGTELMAQFIGDFFRALKGDNSIERQMLRSEGARAMREAVHLACREGLMVAVEAHPVPTAGGPAPGVPSPGVTPPPPAAPPTVPPVPIVPPQQHQDGTQGDRTREGRTQAQPREQQPRHGGEAGPTA
ncbi:hypothetical protein ACH4VR_01640 [Streptomyces sp. NPDC020883]|uniref:hypothetical protein n=1 Tax=Streptomyces sp. NPDC020883 TaxID=3365099 RepID=UPI00379F2F02